MKPKYTPLHKLTDRLKSYNVKVKVVQKGPPRHTPPKCRYQKLTLKDDEGNTMQGTIFGDDIEVYADAVLHNGEYEISNAPIKPVPAEFRPHIGDYQMNFTGRVSIKPLNLLDCPSGPQYRSLSLVPRTYTSADQTVDVLGVVLFVTEIYPVIHNSIENKVRDIFIVDESVLRPMKISTWNRFALEDAESLPSWAEGFFVVGFTGLCPVTSKGLSLKTGLSTMFINEPTGPKADEMRYWLTENTQKLRQWQEKCIALNTPNTTRTIVAVGVVESKRAATLWQEEKFWVKACMPNLIAADVYAYIACSLCNRRVDAEIGAIPCCERCIGQQTKAAIRSNLKASISDGTGSVKVTTFGPQAEQILDLSTEEIYSFKLNQGDDAFDEKLRPIKEKEMLIHISPTYDLSLSNTLKWVVRAIEPVQIQSSQEVVETTSAAFIESESKLQQSAHALSEATTQSSVQAESVPVGVDRHSQKESKASLRSQASSEAFTQAETIPASLDNLPSLHHQPSIQNECHPSKFSPIETHTKRPHGKSPQRAPAPPSDHVADDSHEDYVFIGAANKKAHDKSPQGGPTTPENVVQHSDEEFVDEESEEPRFD